jgi:putative FmdB family regulatory protein
VAPGQEEEMPQYEYRCKKCGKEFSLFLSISEKERRKAPCPSCKSRAVEQVISPFMTKTSRKS